MHEELEALGGRIEPSMIARAILPMATTPLWDVKIGDKVIGGYWLPLPEQAFVFTAASNITKTWLSSFRSERAAVDWIIAQYFLNRSRT